VPIVRSASSLIDGVLVTRAALGKMDTGAFSNSARYFSASGSLAGYEPFSSVLLYDGPSELLQ